MKSSLLGVITIDIKRPVEDTWIQENNFHSTNGYATSEPIFHRFSERIPTFLKQLFSPKNVSPDLNSKLVVANKKMTRKKHSYLSCHFCSSGLYIHISTLN